jgi:hypothetical protein
MRGKDEVTIHVQLITQHFQPASQGPFRHMRKEKHENGIEKDTLGNSSGTGRRSWSSHYLRRELVRFRVNIGGDNRKRSTEFC